MEEEASGDPVVRVVELLNLREYTEVKTVLCDAAPNIIFTHGWDLVLPIVSAMEQEIAEKSEVNFSLCKDLLGVLVARSNPREVSVSLLENIRLAKSDAVFCAIVKCFPTLLQNISGEKAKLLEWVLDCLYGHVKQLLRALSKNPGKRQASDDCSDEEDGSVGCRLSAVAGFFTALNDQVLKKEPRTAEYGENAVVLRCLMMFLGQIAVLDLRSRAGTTVTRDARLSADELVSNISKRFGDLMKLSISKNAAWEGHEKKIAGEDGDRDVPEPMSPACRAVLAWMVLAEGVEPDSVPCVYSSRYMFEQNLQNITFLLSHSSDHAVAKGVALCSNLVSRLCLEEYCSSDLDNSDLTGLPCHLGRAMVYCSLNEVRKGALTALVAYMKCFQCEARHTLYCRMLQVEKHSGLRGFVVDLYRQDLYATLKVGIRDDPHMGANLESFLEIATSDLLSQEKVNILDYSDCVLAVLNLVWYFTSAMSRQGQIFGTTNPSVFAVARAYTEKVRKCVDHTRAYYTAELEDNKKTAKGGAKQRKDSLFPSLPPEQEAEFLKTALTRLDLIESVLVLAEDGVAQWANK